VTCLAISLDESKGAGAIDEPEEAEDSPADAQESSSGPALTAWGYPLGGGLAAGFVAGLFGVGGGILLVPVLVILLRRSQHVAHATSLVAITIPATTAAARFGIDGEVAWGGAAAVAVGALVGVRVGSALMPRISERRLRLIFAIFLALMALRLVLVGDASLVDPVAPGALELGAGPLLLHALLGILVGAASALLGIGGGVVIVPALVLFFGYGQHLAEGTSLAIIVPTALFGAISHARHGYTEWPVGLKLGAGGLVGALLGAELALALPAGTLARAFGVLLVVVTTLMLIRGRRSADA
jgi:uncharacterized protein